MQYYYRREDQKVGPMPWDALVEIAKKGTLRPTDEIWADDWESWKVASSVSGLLVAEPTAGRPLGADLFVRTLVPVGLSGWAIAAGYLALFSFFLIPAPFALLTGILAVRSIKKHPEKRGMGRACFGIVMGVLGTGLLLATLFLRK